MALIRRALTALAVCTIAPAGGHAATYLNRTRVIIAEPAREASLQLVNAGAQPVLFQIWIDAGDAAAAPEQLDVPFFVDAPVFRLDQGHSKQLRILSESSRQQLPKDRESMFWMNALEVPATPSRDATHRVQFAFQSRIKLFYRPKALQAPQAEGFDASMAQLQFLLRCEGPDSILEIDNGSPYHHTLLQATLLRDGHAIAVAEPDPGLLLPMSKTSIALSSPRDRGTVPITVRYTLMNDFGVAVEKQKPLSNAGCK